MLKVSGTAKSVKWSCSRAEYFKICENYMLRNGNVGLKMGVSRAAHIPNMRYMEVAPPPLLKRCSKRLCYHPMYIAQTPIDACTVNLTRMYSARIIIEKRDFPLTLKRFGLFTPEKLEGVMMPPTPPPPDLGHRSRDGRRNLDDCELKNA